MEYQKLMNLLDSEVTKPSKILMMAHEEQITPIVKLNLKLSC